MAGIDYNGDAKHCRRQRMLHLQAGQAAPRQQHGKHQGKHEKDAPVWQVQNRQLPAAMPPVSPSSSPHQATPFAGTVCHSL